MVNAVGFHRINLLKVGKDRAGERIYNMQTIPEDLLKVAQKCALHGMGLSKLTKHV